MSKVSNKTHVQLFYLLAQYKKDMNIFKPTKEDINYVTNLIFISNYFKPNTFNVEFEYLPDDEIITSKQINNAFNFIHVDYSGIIDELSRQTDRVYDEMAGLYIGEDVLPSFDMKNNQSAKNLATTLYFQKKYNATKYGDCKKELTKEKIHNKIDLENLKYNFQQLVKDLKKTKYSII